MMRAEIQKMYKSAENAYATLDFYGKGAITFEDLISSAVVQNIILKKYSKDILSDFLNSENVFPEETKGMNFDSFKKYFFPNHANVEEDKDDAYDEKMANRREEFLKKFEKQP